MSLALLFPGQGVQHAAMLPWLDDHPLAAAPLAAMSDLIGADWRARLHDDAWAGSNLVAQCLLTGVCAAAWQALAPALPRPQAVAGYSVGELAAFSAAGVFDVSLALRLAQRRAAEMDACAAATQGGLVSVSGVSARAVDAVCERFGLSVAIRIAADRCVLGGPVQALAAAMPAWVEAGGEGVSLRVQVASHTKAMAAAADAFGSYIEPLPWQAAQCIIATDFDGRGRRDVVTLKRALAQQIAATVHWDRCMDTLAERRPRCVLEVGPGTSLARMWAARYPDVPVRSADEFHSVDAVVAWVRETLT